MSISLEAVDLNLLVALGHLLERRSVSVAATEMGVTQSTMSHSLKKLRAVLGDELLVRRGRGMALTERAEELRPRVSSALLAVRGVYDEPLAPAPKFTMRIAGPDEAIAVLVPPLLRRLRECAPGIDLRQPPLSLETISMLTDGRLDLALAPRLGNAFQVPDPVRAQIEELVFDALYEDEFVLVMRPDHPRGTSPLSLEEFASLDHALVAPSGDSTGFVDTALSERGLRRRIVATSATFLGMFPILYATDLIAVLPRALVRAVPTPVACLEVPLSLPKITMGALWSPDNRGVKRHAFVRQLLREVAAALPR